ncbi:MAG: glutamine-hydrolyzing GMP synthase [Candidatus Peribacteraceae bacterium]|nr:glutamine-hydrolyzing GMP synthase [Candidatus Peribacteraceae bacterium]
MMKLRSIIILDFGGQYAHLIASRVRRLGAHSEIRDPETKASALKNAAGIILSGGPQSVYDPGSPAGDPGIFSLGIPVLGICYGLQWMTKALGGEVKQGAVKEYGPTVIEKIGAGGALLEWCPQKFIAWMSHGDEAKKLPEGFARVATSKSCANAAISNETRHFYAVQFHPEVTHTEYGQEILKRFVSLCHADPWSISGYAKRIGEEIKAAVQGRHVFMLVSGGVDSSVAFTLLNRVLGPERVQGLLVDTGLMRSDEVHEVRSALQKLGIRNLRIEDASEEFFVALKDVYDPEEKRRAIGETFLSVQKRVSEKMGLTHAEGWMLGQGTIYPDTIETGGTKHADHIKTHHNRVQAVQDMIVRGLVVEPLKDLYKDEVRRLGEELGLPHELVWRHPFPGPGLGVRILCEEAPQQLQASSFPFGPERPSGPSNDKLQAGKVAYAVLPVRSVGVQGDGRTYRHALALFSDHPCMPTGEIWKLATEIPNKMSAFNRVLLCTSQSEVADFVFTPGFVTRARADVLRAADRIVSEEMHVAGLYEKIWQFPVVLLPFGLKKGGQSVVLRPIESTDAMTADAVRLPEKVLKSMTERILKIQGIDLVFYDLTSKPPATIEWE